MSYPFDPYGAQQRTKVEPSAKVREGTADLFELYQGLLDAGFPQPVAQSMVLEMIREGMRTGNVCTHCGKRPTDA